ncbi:MAG: hypothetical protein J6Y29_05655 [Clostridiales bacterium]|nr:hypothetical protein [Clostridiales bacterium]
MDLLRACKIATSKERTSELFNIIRNISNEEDRSKAIDLLEEQIERVDVK